MKKIKYILGFLIVGTGFLLSQSFGIDVQLVNTQFNTGFQESNYTKSFSYLYQFNSVNSSSFGGCLGDSLYYNKSLDYSRACFMSNNFNLSYDYVFNNSIYSLDVYTGWTYNVSAGWDRHRSSNINSNQNYVPKVLFGTNGNFGKNVIYTDCYMGGLDCGGVSPKFFLGGPDYFSGTSWSEFTLSDIGNSFRVFFNSAVGNNIISDTNTNTPTSFPSSFGWQYFTNTQTRTNFGYIVDTNGYKGKHFGSMGYGYSFVYNKDIQSQLQNKISWDKLGFSTISDDVLVNLRAFGGLDIIHNISTNSQEFTDGVLILRNIQYTSHGDEGVIVISKNPNNYKQLLYQEFSCQTNNFSCISRGLSKDSNGNLVNYCPSYIISNQNTAYNPCLVLSQGLLSYNGSTDILPFESKGGLVNISDYPILSTLFDTSSSMLGNTYTDGPNFCIDSLCFAKVSSSDSIKENYLNGVYSNPYEFISSGELQNGTYELCRTNAYFAAVNYEICHGVNPSDIVSISGVNYIVTDVQYDDGTILKQVIPIPDYYAGTTTLSNGFTVTVCTPDNPCVSSNSGSNYLSGGILGTGYYSFDNTGLFFKCPYPYTNLLSIGGWNLNFGDFDVIGPINCFISAFQHGKSFDFLDNAGLFNFGPLISGDSDNHRILYRFFDIVLSLGVILFLSVFYRRFK